MKKIAKEGGGGGNGASGDAHAAHIAMPIKTRIRLKRTVMRQPKPTQETW